MLLAQIDIEQGLEEAWADVVTFAPKLPGRTPRARVHRCSPTRPDEAEGILARFPRHHFSLVCEARSEIVAPDAEGA